MQPEGGDDVRRVAVDALLIGEERLGCVASGHGDGAGTEPRSPFAHLGLGRTAERPKRLHGGDNTRMSTLEGPIGSATRTQIGRAPAPMVIAPGHDGRVVGDETAVLVQYDCGPGTWERLGLPTEHQH